MRAVRALLLVLLLAGCTSPSPAAESDLVASAEAPRVHALVPMRDRPTLDGVLDEHEAWGRSWSEAGTFVLRGERFPFRVWLACTEHGLHLALRIDSAPPAADVSFLFAPGDSGALRPPSDLLRVGFDAARPLRVGDGSWNGAAWLLQATSDAAPVDPADARPTSGRRVHATLADGALVVEGFVHPEPPVPEHDGLRLDEGARFRMALLLETPEGARGAWPRPGSAADPSEWPVLEHRCAAAR